MTRSLVLLLALLATPAWAESGGFFSDAVTAPSPSIIVAFSPHAGATEAVVQVISEAQHSIHLAGYGFTSKPIAQALIAAHSRGVEVDAVLDKSNATARFTEAGDLAQAGIPVRLDYRYAIMHNKFIVVDGQTVETGSFNYTTAAADHNAENILVVRDDPAVAGQYEARWQKLWAESRNWTQRDRAEP